MIEDKNLVLLSENDCKKALFNILANFENKEKEAYFDSSRDGVKPSIGVGFNLKDSNVRTVVFEEMGLVSGPNSSDNKYIDDLLDIIGDTSITEDADLSRKLNDVMERRADAFEDEDYREKFELSADEMRSIFNGIIDTYEERVDNWLDENIPQSRERIALVSLAYNSPTGPKDLLGMHLKGAIESKNRAQAWLEIRYRSNNGSLNDSPPNDVEGIAKRRYFESEIFGLFNNSSSGEGIPEEEALQAYRVFIENRDKILKYESLYGVNPDGTAGERNMISEANSHYDFADVEVQTLEESFAPATEVLLEEYVTSLDESLTDTISFQNILVDRMDNDGSTETGTGTIEPLVGGDENDLLLGSDSGAALDGGKGNDVLWGGGKMVASLAGRSEVSLSVAPTPAFT